jgi:hypothetical protein
MSDGVVIAIISSVTSIIVAIITVIVKGIIDKKKVEESSKSEECVREDSLGNMIYIQEFIENLRIEYKFDRIGICQFHNGGKFFSGHSMKKFSMTYETCAPGIEKIKRNYQNIMVSEFPHLISGLLKNDYIVIYPDTLGYPSTVREMTANGIVQFVVIPIRGLSGDMAGFLYCHNIGDPTDIINEEFLEDIKNKADQISGYILK